MKESISKSIKFRVKYNLALGWFSLGSIFLISFIFSKTSVNQIKAQSFGSTIILLSLFSILVLVPYIWAFLKIQKFEIEDNILKVSYLFGIAKKEVDLNKIVKVTAKEKLISYTRDLRLIMGIKQIKDIQIEFIDNISIKIDGNVFEDKDYLKFKQAILKFTKNR